MKLRAGLVILGLAAVSIAAGATAIMHVHAPAMSETTAVWSQEAWPFLIDQWGTGQAFGCSGGPCGAGLHLYLRAKIGFCRCATGVSDDDEIDRVGDTELLGSKYAPLAPGHSVYAGVLTGRARVFKVERTFRSSLPVLTVALANRCDAVVATVISDSDVLPKKEQMAVDFLRSDLVQRWADTNTGSN
jgi:hypothetical protein